MNIIVPMAGRGSRLRPHTLSTPKPLFPIAGKTIVQRLVEDIADMLPAETAINEIVYVIGDFGEAVEQELLDIAASLGATGRITYQDQPLGTAHAIQCAGDSLTDEVVIAFADTLFRADFQLDRSKDGLIWVKEVEDPANFGVVEVDDAGHIVNLWEKPSEFVSDLAIIGIYYLKDGAALRREIDYLIDNDIKDKGEYQLTNALENLKDKGHKLVPGPVTDWMDCGNKANILATNQRVLRHEAASGRHLIAPDAELKEVKLIEPCYIGPGVRVEQSVIGPHVTLERNSQVAQSVISESILREEANVSGRVLQDSIIGAKAVASPQRDVLNLGDFSAA